MNSLLSMTDEQLVVLYAAGNNKAFDILIERYRQPLYGYILCAVHDREVANDLFQDMFVKAITTIRQGRYSESGKFKAWLTRIAHNLIVDYFRQEQIENTVSHDRYEVDLFNNPKFSEETVESMMVKTQTLADVKKLVSHLPDSQREVLEMRYYRDMSFKEIAELTGVSINTALGRMRYALQNMRKIADDNKMILSLH